MRMMKEFICKHRYNVREIINEIIDDEDVYKYLLHMKGKDLVIEFRPQVKNGTKQAIYDYYHGILLPVAIQAYTDSGYELMDQVKVDYMLKAECAKGTMITPKGEEIYLLDKSKMTKDRLVKFVSDCIVHLEMNLGAIVPRSDEYKSLKETGYLFTSVNNIKK